MLPLLTTPVADGPSLPVLVWRLDPPLLALSIGPLGGDSAGTPLGRERDRADVVLPTPPGRPRGRRCRAPVDAVAFLARRLGPAALVNAVAGEVNTDASDASGGDGTVTSAVSSPGVAGPALAPDPLRMAQT